MKTQSTLLNISIIVSITSLGIGYLLAGYWLVMSALLLLTISWVLATQKPAFWLGAISLLGSVILAAAGVVVNLSLILMVIACTTALVSWELTNFKHSIAGSSQTGSILPMMKNHRQSLALAAFIGLGLALLSSFLNLQLPFGVIVLLVLIAFGGLVYSIKYSTKNKI